jgi:hypothetical protein
MDDIYDIAFETEALKAKFAEDILTQMEKNKMSYVDMGKAMGKSRQHVYKILGDNKGINLRTMVEFANAVGKTLKITLEPSDDSQDLTVESEEL